MMTTTGTMTTMTGTTETTTEHRRHGLSVRVRIAITVAVLVTAALAGVGMIVYVVETERVESSVRHEVEQELEEFDRLNTLGIDPRTGEPFTTIRSLLRTFLERNVPDDDEMLVGWVDGHPSDWYPDDPLRSDPEFLRHAERLVDTGGSTRFDSEWGEIILTAQPIEQGDQRGALLVVAYLSEDMAELQATMRTFTIVAIPLIIMIVAVAAWQSGRLLRPLRVLQATADKISDTDLSERIPEEGNDDITALTRTVNGMLDRLDTAFTGQRQFLDDVGHELRTPLTIIQGHLELLEFGDPEEFDAIRGLVLEEVDRMSRLVRDLLLLAKSDRPDFVNRGPVHLTDLTVNALAKSRALGDRHWALDGTADVVISADEQRLTQALLQLCDNAVKHTTTDDTIAIGSSAESDRVRMWVRDTGPGIPAEHRDHVFERFGRSERSTDHDDEGFGLGLSIVRAIARAHGGDAHIDDTVDAGTRVIIDLPTEPPPEEATPWPTS